MAITDWPEGERPREKLLLQGAERLSDAELLAIFLRVGVAGKSAVDLGRELLQHCGSLARLFAAGPEELSAIKGIGAAKYVQLQAVLEMARRALAEPLQVGAAFDQPGKVRDYLRLTLGHKPHEVFMVLFLNNQHQLLASEALFHGTLDQAAVYPREVLKRTLHHNAAAVIFAHNHPSGLAQPSRADEQLTRQLQAALALVDVRVLDHFVVTSHAVVSFAERGLL
jgi:DNA repair protein RadC